MMLPELTARRAAQLIPGSQLRIYEGAPHGSIFSDIEHLNRDLISFAKS
jgi:non-heme chloroperoxidase